ncbi:MAG: MFS transporter [bacterium]|nr:MFS transporter [bacterium]
MSRTQAIARAREAATAPLTAGLVLTVAAVAFEALAVPTVMPAVVGELGDLDAYGWMFSAFFLANVVASVAAGQGIDRLGPLPPFAAGMGLFALGLGAAGSATGTPTLIAARAIQGLGGGALWAVVYAVVARAYPADARPRMLAVLSTAWVVPGLVGPALAGVAADHLGWRVIFVGLIPLLGVATALAVPALRRVPRAVPTEADTARRVAAAVVLAAGVVLLLVGLERRGPLLPCLAGGVLLALAGLRPLMPPGVFTLAPGLPAAIVVVGLVCVAFFGAEPGVPLLATALLGQSATAAGLALTGATLTWTAGAWLQARLVRTRSRRALVASGCAVIALGVAAAAASAAGSASIAFVWGAWSLAGLGMGLTHATVSLIVLEEAPEGGEGTASAAMQLANVIGAALGAGVLGAMVATANDTREGLVRGFAAVGAAAVLATAAARRLPASPARSSDAA